MEAKRTHHHNSMKDKLKRGVVDQGVSMENNNDDHHLLSAAATTTTHEDEKKKRISAGFKKGSGGGGGAMRCCQAEKCAADLSDAKQYHRRHKVCEQHSKAQVVIVGGIRQRFCQQCSRFHELSEFDEAKRSCRRRLAGHNERRRKIPAAADHHHHAAEGSSSTSRKVTASAVGTIQINIQENATNNYKHFQIRS